MQCGVGEDGKPAWDIAGFQEQALDFAGRTFDVVLLWTTLDYLPERWWLQWLRVSLLR